MRRLGRGVRPPLPGARRRRAPSSASRRQAPELLPRAVGPRRRRARRGPHVHLLRARGGRRPDQQLAGPRPRCARRSTSCSAARCAAARCTSCRSRWARSARRVAEIGVQLTDSPYVAVSMRIMTRMGAGALDCLGDDGDVRPVPALGRRAARRRRDDAAVAVQRREVHRPLPRDARDLVLRLGLRRQRAARQEVLRAADRLGDGARRGLDGRAHADPQAHLARGRGQVRHRRVPERLRQDEPRDADPDDRGLEGRDGRRRHRLDEVRRRTAACTRSTPRPASSASRPGTGAKTNPNAMATIAREHDLHQLRADRRRRRLVGGHDRRAAGAR